eukprot:scaffold137258_cov30-Attheya_sp.AAC.1
MHQTRQGIRSTKPQSDDTQSPIIQENRTNTVYLAIIDPKDPISNIYTDLCGRFLILSAQGNQYIFILYDYDSNAILSRAMKNRSDKEITRVFSELADTLKDRGFKPQYHVLDNECSAALKSETLTLHYIPISPPRNASSERTMQNAPSRPSRITS